MAKTSGITWEEITDSYPRSKSCTGNPEALLQIVLYCASMKAGF
jgi:hypothetical protein